MHTTTPLSCPDWTAELKVYLQSSVWGIVQPKLTFKHTFGIENLFSFFFMELKFCGRSFTCSYNEWGLKRLE